MNIGINVAENNYDKIKVACSAYEVCCDYLQYKIQHADFHRMEEGLKKVETGVFKLFGGAGITYASLAPAVTGFGVILTIAGGTAGIVTMFSGGSDIGEGVQDIYYGWNGDSTSHSINITRDTIYRGYDDIYDVSTGTAAAVGFFLTPIMLAAKPQNTGKITASNSAEVKGENSSGSGSWAAQTPRTGEEWNQYFQETYGAENVHWNAKSFEHIVEHPETLYGSTQSEIARALGDGWTVSSYGKSGTGWKFVNNRNPDLMVFYHNADGVHGGAYYGFSSGITGTVKLVDDAYILLPGDNATIIQMNE